MAIQDKINEILAVNALGRDLLEGIETLFSERSPPPPSSSSIEDFKAYFAGAGEFSRTDLFNVIVEVPPEISSSFSLSSRDLIFQCEGAELPGKSIDVLTLRHNLFIDRVPVDVMFPEVTLQFICRSDLLEKKVFDAWMNTMINTDEDDWRYGLVKYKRGATGEAHRPYDTSVTICQKFHVPTALNASAIKLIDAMPIQVASMPLNWQDTSFHKLSVTFAYRRWEDTTVKLTSTERIETEDALLPDRQEFSERKVGSVVTWKDVSRTIPEIKDWKTILGVDKFFE